MNTAAAIREARSALGLTLPTVAEAVRLDPQSLLRFESGEQELPGAVLWRLSDVLGVPFEDLDSLESVRRHIETVSVRFKSDRHTISERVRLAVARSSAAAREYVELEQLSGTPPRYERLDASFSEDPRLPATRVWSAGRDLALSLRDQIAEHGPIRSMLSLVENLGILVLWQKLPQEIAGYAYCDKIHGPAIVLNVNGRNVNELTRRFTLAHELCHVLFDRRHLQEMSAFDSYDDLYFYLDDTRDPRETRANAFAIHLLAPADRFAAAWGEYRDIQQLMTTFGVNFEAVRYHLDNYNLFPWREKVSGVATTASDEWKSAESAELWYPAFDVIPIERRHAVAKLAFALWTAGTITTNRLREALGVNLDREELQELADLYVESRAA